MLSFCFLVVNSPSSSTMEDATISRSSSWHWNVKPPQKSFWYFVIDYLVNFLLKKLVKLLNISAPFLTQNSKAGSVWAGRKAPKFSHGKKICETELQSATRVLSIISQNKKVRIKHTTKWNNLRGFSLPWWTSTPITQSLKGESNTSFWFFYSGHFVWSSNEVLFTNVTSSLQVGTVIDRAKHQPQPNYRGLPPFQGQSFRSLKKHSSYLSPSSSSEATGSTF